MTAMDLLILLGAAIFVGVMLCLHVIRRDLSPMHRGMSRYAGGTTLFPATVAFIALAGAMAALATTLGTRPRACAAVGAAGLLMVAATPIGRPATRPVLWLHALGGLLFYLGVYGAMGGALPVASAGVLRWAFVATLLLFLAGAAGVAGPRSAVGALQRLVFAVVIVWLTTQALA